MRKDVKIDVGILPTLLTLLFIFFKLTDTIDWSWWWVLSPLWIPMALFLVIAAAVRVFGRS